MKVKVSVILPSLNVSRYIKECIESVLNQSLRELEIVCIDAGSTDGTREILQDYAKKDSRIIVLDSDVKSYGRQVNIGLEHSTGEYIAILETDDWIAPNMYQCLYEQASEDRLDYAAADFDKFYQLQTGNYYFIRQHLFGKNKLNWYGKVLNSEQIATLRASDYVLWKGIYNKAFLNRHHIRLHESSGAAFQDMGFLQQVKTYAMRAKYIDESFYRYRQGREGASSNVLEGLGYYEKEFLWIVDNLRLPEILKNIHKKYLYYTMSISFITKYEHILTGLNGDCRDKRLSNSYLWFKRQISEAVNNGLLEETMYGKEVWERMVLLLTSQEAHARQFMKIVEKKEKSRDKFLRIVGKRPVVIFGCGIRGERLMLFCDRNHIRIDSFCDNDAALHNGLKFGFPVIPPEELKSRINDNNDVVVLSMKGDVERVYMQLLKLGVGADRIINEIPEGVL